jgi:hypothetical protein
VRGSTAVTAGAPPGYEEATQRREASLRLSRAEQRDAVGETEARLEVALKDWGASMWRTPVCARVLRIPAKANTDSGENANGIPGRRRTVLGA